MYSPITTEYTYEYHLKDHLGSPRVVFVPTSSGKEVVQINAYYPGGAPIAALSFNNPNYNNRYLREGKEYISDHGWNKYDFHWRAFCSWSWRSLQIDPHAESYPWMSPYALWGNNPLKYTDPTGMWLKPTHNYILRKAFKNELKSGEITKAQLKQMMRASVDVDKGDNQLPKNSYLHSQTDGTANQSIEEAQALRQDFIDEHIENFIDSGGEDFYELGQALHPISDEDSPSHNWSSWSGTQWYNPVSWVKGAVHLAREITIFGLFRKNSTNKSIEKVRTAYQEAKSKAEEERAKREEERRKREQEDKERQNNRPWE